MASKRKKTMKTKQTTRVPALFTLYRAPLQGLRFGTFSFLCFTSRSSTASRSRTAFAIRVSADNSSSNAALSGSRYKGCMCFLRFATYQY